MPQPKATLARQKDKLFSTQLLLRNIKFLRLHCENIKPVSWMLLDAEAISNVFFEAARITDREIRVNAIDRSRGRTQILLDNVENALKAWEENSKGTYVKRLRLRIIRGLYLDDQRKTIPQMAEIEKKPRDIIAKHLQIALREISGLLFGADGLLKTTEAMYLHTFEGYPSRPRQ